MNIGYRDTLKRHEKEVHSLIVCKTKAFVSLHPDDDKEFHFLKRQAREYEADPRHVRALLRRYNLNQPDAKAAMTPGMQEKAGEIEYHRVEAWDASDPPLQKPDDLEQDRPSFWPEIGWTSSSA